METPFKEVSSIQWFACYSQHFLKDKNHFTRFLLRRSSMLRSLFITTTNSMLDVASITLIGLVGKLILKMFNARLENGDHYIYGKAYKD